MDLASIIGIVAGLVLVGQAMAAGGAFGSFMNLPSALMVIGGTIAATLVAFKLTDVLGVMRVAKNVFLHKARNSGDIVELIVDLADKARREGVLLLEQYVQNYDDKFLQSGIQLLVDGTDRDTIRDVLEKEIQYLEDRHIFGQSIFLKMGAYAPAFGMIGTLIGLIQMLRTLDDPSGIGGGMAIALITTFYGSLFANLLFLPMADKLRIRSQQEVLLREMIIEGLVSIQAGDLPRVVRSKLLVFMSPKERASEEK